MDEARYLGPAQVLATTGALRVRREDGREVDATAAFTFPYEAASGDLLLVLEGDGEAHFAIGVLAGRAPEALAFQGDVSLRAVGGTLSLRGDEGLEVDAPHLTLRGETLRTFAGALTEKADTALRWVRDQLTVRAGESRRTVHGEDHSRSKRSVTLAQGVVKIDGHQVHLGH